MNQIEIIRNVVFIMSIFDRCVEEKHLIFNLIEMSYKLMEYSPTLRIDKINLIAKIIQI